MVQELTSYLNCTLFADYVQIYKQPGRIVGATHYNYYLYTAIRMDFRWHYL